MNDYERMRQWLADQDGPQGVKQFSVALGIKRAKAAGAVAEMYRSGALVRHPTTPYSYTLGAAPRRRHRLTEQESREAYRLHSINYRRRNGCVPRAEYEAACKASREAKAEAKRKNQIVKAAVMEVRKAATRERERVRLANRRPSIRKPKPKAAPVKRVVLRFAAAAPVKPEPVIGPLMSSAEWEAMGGKVERLPVFWEQAA